MNESALKERLNLPLQIDEVIQEINTWMALKLHNLFR